MHRYLHFVEFLKKRSNNLFDHRYLFFMLNIGSRLCPLHKGIHEGKKLSSMNFQNMLTRSGCSIALEFKLLPLIYEM